MRDFTLKMYQKMLTDLTSAGYQTCRVVEYMRDPEKKNKKILVLRHDVDRRPYNALKMAQLEAELNIKSTYYFRYKPHTFCKKSIREIESLGHEVGYHYETLTKAKGNAVKAYALFKQELSAFREICCIQTVSMHGSPLSRWDNRDLWKDYDVQSLGVQGEPYLNLSYDSLHYFTDTGRSWSSDRCNFRDRVSAQSSRPIIKTSNELVNYLTGTLDSAMLQTHPERWGYSHPTYYYAYGFDCLVNTAKYMLSMVR